MRVCACGRDFESTERNKGRQAGIKEGREQGREGERGRVRAGRGGG